MERKLTDKILKWKWRMEREPLEAVTEAVEEILGIEIDEDMVEGDVLEIEIGIVIEDTEVEVDASMEAIAGMTRQAIEAMAEIDLNGDLTVEETILEEMIEIEVQEAAINHDPKIKNIIRTC